MTRPAKAKSHGEFTGQRANRGCSNTVDTHLFLMAFVEKAILLIDEIRASSSRSNQYPDSARLVAVERLVFKAGIRQSLFNCSHTERHSAGNMLPLSWIHVLAFIEVPHLPGYLDRKGGRVKACDSAHTAYSAGGRTPERLASNAVRAHSSYSGDYDTSFHFQS